MVLCVGGSISATEQTLGLVPVVLETEYTMQIKVQAWWLGSGSVKDLGECLQFRISSRRCPDVVKVARDRARD